MALGTIRGFLSVSVSTCERLSPSLQLGRAFRRAGWATALLPGFRQSAPACVDYGMQPNISHLDGEVAERERRGQVASKISTPAFQQVKDSSGGLQDIGAGSEDGSHTMIEQKLVVLTRDDPPDDHYNVFGTHGSQR